MREFKFRIWCKDKNEWEKDTCMLTPYGVIIHPRGITLRKDSHIISQYTGYTDKNEEEIYEGDLTKVECNSILLSTGEVVGKSIAIYEILWHEDTWANKLVKVIEGEGHNGTIGYITNGLKIHAGFCEVIGNIYQGEENKGEEII